MRPINITPVRIIALSHVVSRFPNKLQRFARDSITEDGNVMWFLALAHSFAREPGQWLRIVGAADVVYITVVHLCGSHLAAREAATVAINALATHSASPGYQW